MLKHENVYTVEDLKQKVIESSISPKAIFKTLDFTFDWKKFVEPNLAGPQLANHTKYHSFQLTRENDRGVLR